MEDDGEECRVAPPPSIPHLEVMKKMRITYLALYFLFCSVCLCRGQIKLVHFKGPIYISEDYYYARENSVVYLDNESVCIIGATWTPDTARMLHQEIQKITDLPISAVINTNFHPDRSGGNAYWKSIGCEIHSTEMTYHLLESEWDQICKWTRNGLKDYPDVSLSLPTHQHPGNFEIKEGKIKVFYFGAAHTKDGVLVYFPTEKILYGGCTLKSFLGNLEQADLTEYPKTLKKIKDSDLEIDQIIAGHGRAIHGIELIDHDLSLLKSKQSEQGSS